MFIFPKEVVEEKWEDNLKSIREKWKVAKDKEVDLVRK